jgi:hypothetical protein
VTGFLPEAASASCRHPLHPLAAELAADYGEDGAELVILDGARRGARFGSPASAAAYWQAVLDFLDD